MKLQRYINRKLMPLLKISSLYISIYTPLYMLILFNFIVCNYSAMGFGLKDVYENLLEKYIEQLNNFLTFELTYDKFDDKSVY